MFSQIEPQVVTLKKAQMCDVNATSVASRMGSVHQ